ncbi:hypothetical protein RUND412_003755 [Rhizina undulata]
MATLGDREGDNRRERDRESGDMGASKRSANVWACSGGTVCTFCEKTKRRCIYEARPVRLPLTRRNLDTLSDRCKKLEAILRSLDPSIDIEVLLESHGLNLAETDFGGVGGYVNSRNLKGTHVVDIGVGIGVVPDVTMEAGMVMGMVEDDGSLKGEDLDEEEVDPEIADGFEWYEGGGAGEDVNREISGLSDGMASLNIDSRDVGYLGKSSGASLLRTVHKLLTRRHKSVSPLQSPSEELMEPLFAPFTAPLTPVSSHPHAEHSLSASYTRNTLIDAYFQYYHSSYPIIHEQTFRIRCSKLNSIPYNSPWLLLYHMVLTVGAFVSSTRAGENLDFRIYSIIRAELSTALLESGTLERVQALALMGSYLQKRDRPNTGYNIAGVALRMALGLGLHRDFPENFSNTLGREIRRRTWWTIYIFDVGASITFGRPTMPSDRVYARIPSNVEDSHLINTDQLLPPEIDACTPYSAMIAHANLVVIANRIHHSLFAGSKPISSKRQPLSRRDLIHSFDDQISRWKRNLPSYFRDSEVPHWFRAPRFVIEWKEQNIRMIMYKFFLSSISEPLRQSDSNGHIQDSRRIPATTVSLDPNVRRCLGIALETVASVHEFCNTTETLRQGISWYGAYFTFQAALVLIIAMLRAPNDTSTTIWKSGVERALASLELMSQSSPAAGRCLSVLNKVLERSVGLPDKFVINVPPPCAAYMVPFPEETPRYRCNGDLLQAVISNDETKNVISEHIPAENLGHDAFSCVRIGGVGGEWDPFSMVAEEGRLDTGLEVDMGGIWGMGGDEWMGVECADPGRWI